MGMALRLDYNQTLSRSLDAWVCTSSIEAAVFEDLGLDGGGHGQLLWADTDVWAAVQHTLGSSLGDTDNSGGKMGVNSEDTMIGWYRPTPQWKNNVCDDDVGQARRIYIQHKRSS